MNTTFALIPVLKKIAPVLLLSAFLLPLPALAETGGGKVELCPVTHCHETAPGEVIAFGGNPPAAPATVGGLPDADGVPDVHDWCPDTPTGVSVNANGCPLDTDDEGVSDDLDKCPNTRPGVTVDNRGCPKSTGGVF